MKITKERLKTLIHEELQKIAEEEGEMTSSDFRQATRKRAPDELALINKVTKQLQLIASKKNLGASGQVTTLLKRLIPLLDAETQKIGE